MTDILTLGLDPSKSTGWAIHEPSKLTPRFWGNAFKCGTFEMPEKCDVYYTADMVGQKLTTVLKECKEEHGRLPDFAVIEGQAQAQVGGSNFAGSIYPWIAASSLVSTLGRFRIPYATLMPITWRIAFFGQGFKPPFKEHKLDKPDPKTGKTVRIEWLWKDAAINRLRELGVDLPKSKALADDAAEACALAYCWKTDAMKFHAKRYHQPWMDLRTGAYEQKRRVA